MLDNVMKFLTKSNTGRFVLAGLVIVGVGYGARLYLVDLPAMQEKSQRGTGADRLEAVADALDALVEERGEAYAKELPALTEWYPSPLPCGTERAFDAPAWKEWEQLGLDPKEKTTFQYRLEFADDEYRLIARRDTDCDGHFAVWTLTGGTGLATRKLRAQNIEE